MKKHNKNPALYVHLNRGVCYIVVAGTTGGSAKNVQHCVERKIYLIKNFLQCNIKSSGKVLHWSIMNI